MTVTYLTSLRPDSTTHAPIWENTIITRGYFSLKMLAAENVGSKDLRLFQYPLYPRLGGVYASDTASPWGSRKQNVLRNA
mmetsp:Transcript_4090/g.11662  ORF Transcript_4090/g.11662 Transcript_4090/m.11662 type:complete len:80 (-) Transcript_4090:2915-3154(-)